MLNLGISWPTNGDTLTLDTGMARGHWEVLEDQDQVLEVRGQDQHQDSEANKVQEGLLGTVPIFVVKVA